MPGKILEETNETNMKLASENPKNDKKQHMKTTEMIYSKKIQKEKNHKDYKSCLKMKYFGLKI